MKVLITVVITIASLLLLGLIFIYSGIYNIAASKGHNPVVRWVLNTIQERSIIVHASNDTIKPSEDIASGIKSFSSMCVMCHDSPIQQRWDPASSMTPKPPELHHAAQEWSISELYWIVEHGIKMTGMPAFGLSHKRNELIEIVSFVDRLPAISADEYRQLANGLENNQNDTIHQDKHQGK